MILPQQPRAPVLAALLFLGTLFLLNSAAAQPTEHPLMPAVTDSPRSTLFGFIEEMERTYQLGTSDEGDASAAALERAVQSLDLSELPPNLAEDRGTEAALMLKEVFDRIQLPAPDAVPGSNMVSQAGTGEGVSLKKWDIPNTEISIALVTEGDRAGEYLFTPETVARAGEFYHRVRHLPYKTGATPEIYEAYLTTPGAGLELKWSWVYPQWSTRIIGGQTIWQWIAGLLAILLTIIFFRIVLLAGLRLDKRQTTEQETDDWQRWSPATTVAILVSLAIAAFTKWLVDDVINLTGDVLGFVIFGFSLAQYLLVCWLIVVVVRQLTEMLIGFRKLNVAAASSQLIRLVSLLVTVSLVVAVLVYAGQRFGLPAYSIVTGLGVGGIAIGFGAQSLVRDIFSGIFFLLDDAFRVGEYVDIDGTVGTVDKISIRSLRLRHHLGALHIIPYGEITKLTNNSRDWVIVKQEFTVPFDTDLNKVRKLFKKVGQEMYGDNPHYAENILEPFKLQGVTKVNDIGIVVRSKFMAKPGTQFIIRKDLYARIQKVFEENGIEFARKEVLVKVPGLQESTDLNTTQKQAIAGAAGQAAEGD